MSVNRAARWRAQAKWRKHVPKMDIEAGGLWQCELIRQNSPHREETVLATLHSFATLRWGTSLAPIRLLCDAAFCWPTALPDHDVMQAALRVCRDSFISDAREVHRANVHTSGGRA
jgi:hypothetical protein